MLTAGTDRRMMDWLLLRCDTIFASSNGFMQMDKTASK